MTPVISVINNCSVLSDHDIQIVVPALQKQVSLHLAPAWGVNASLVFVPKGHHPAPKTWWFVIMDTSDEQGALGYHDLTNDGYPISKIFVKTDIQYGAKWTITASHELAEMLCDPDLVRGAFIQSDDTTGTVYAWEVADACEDDSYGYQIGGVWVSDFVYPSWFETYQPTGTQFDYM